MATKSWYTPLDSIDGAVRLVRLLPRLGLKDITCEVFSAQLSDGPKYEALSYEWGDAKSSLKTIDVNGQSVPIRENLWHALWNLTYEVEPRVLWIDALCINQDDVAERNQQVQQVGRTYNQAFRVVAWIGDLEQSSLVSLPTSPIMSPTLESAGVSGFFSAQDSGEDTSDSIRNSTMAALSHLQRATRVAADDIDTLRTLQGLSADSMVWDGLENLCRRRCWSRLWIVSEILSAYELAIQCGETSFSWKALDELLILARSTYISLPRNAARAARLKGSAFQRLSTHRHRMLAQQDPMSISDLVLHQYGPHFRCRELLDKVFALLSISTSCCKKAIPINYNMTIGQLCKAVIKHYFAQHWSSVHGQKFDIIHALYYHLWPESLVGWTPMPFSVMHEPSYIFSEQETHNNCHPFTCEDRGRVTWVSGPINLDRFTRIFQLQPMNRPKPSFNAKVRATIEAFLLWQKSEEAAREPKKEVPPRRAAKEEKKRAKRAAERPSSAPATRLEFADSRNRSGSTPKRGHSSTQGSTTPGPTQRTSSFTRFFSRAPVETQEDIEADEALWHEWLQLMDKKEETKKVDQAQRLLLTDTGTITLSPGDVQVGDKLYDLTPEWDGILITRRMTPSKVVGLTHLAFEKLPRMAGRGKQKIHVDHATLQAMARYLIR